MIMEYIFIYNNFIFRLLNVKDIIDRLHCNVCLLEYRGFGHSDGTPSEEGIYMDAQAALNYLTTYQRSDVIDPRKVGGLYKPCLFRLM